MSTKHSSSSEPINPQVGQLLYNEYINDEDGSFKFGSLIVIDSPTEEGSEWYYTQLAHMEDFGQGMEVALQEEAGGMPASVTRVATDDDIKKFINGAVNDSVNSSEDIQNWLQMVKDNPVVLPEEKQRIADLANEVLA